MGFGPLKTVLVTSTSYPALASPQIDYAVDAFKIRFADFSMGATGGTNQVAVSFDGTTDTFILTDGQPNLGLKVPGAQKMWFRNIVGASNTLRVVSRDN